jgi:hypothetical protein
VVPRPIWTKHTVGHENKPLTNAEVGRATRYGLGLPTIRSGTPLSESVHSRT